MSGQTDADDVKASHERRRRLFVIDLTSETASQTVGAYLIDLYARYNEWQEHYGMWAAPETRPAVSEAELRLLGLLMVGNGKIDFQAAFNEMFGKLENGRYLATLENVDNFNMACHNLVTTLSLQEVVPDA